MSKPLIAPAASSVSEVIGLLNRNEVYEAFVESGNKLGVITMRDILNVSDISNMKASSLSLYLSKVSPDDTVAKAASLMTEYRLRALPVAVDGAIKGAITAQSLCRALMIAKEFSNVAVDKIMKRNLVTISREASISKARSLMVKNGIDHLPVVDAGRLDGVLLSSAIVYSMFPKEKVRKGTLGGDRAGYSELSVAGLMDEEVLVCAPQEKAAEVLRKVIGQNKTCAIIKLWDELQGIVTYRDFIGLLAEPEELDVPAYIVGLPDDPFEAHLARSKFMREAKMLRKSFSNIEEIRATIKTKEVSSGKRRYEVKASISMHGKVYAYSADGWDLPTLFDEVGDKMKRLLTRKPDRRGKESLRKAS